MVECTALEMRRGGDSTVGSNPTPSASNAFDGRFFFALFPRERDSRSVTEHHLVLSNLSIFGG